MKVYMFQGRAIEETKIALRWLWYKSNVWNSTSSNDYGLYFHAQIRIYMGRSFAFDKLYMYFESSVLNYRIYKYQVVIHVTFLFI